MHGEILQVEMFADFSFHYLFLADFFCRPMGQNNKIKMRKLNYTEKIEHNINDVNTSGVGKQQRWPKAK